MYNWQSRREEDHLTYAQLKELAANPRATMNSRIYAMELLRQFDVLFPATFGVKTEKI